MTLGDVHAALAYYYGHRAEADARIADGRTFPEALRAQIRSKR